MIDIEEGSEKEKSQWTHLRQDYCQLTSSTEGLFHLKLIFRWSHIIYNLCNIIANISILC